LDCMLIVNQNFAPATIAYKEYALANNTNKAIPCRIALYYMVEGRIYPTHTSSFTYSCAVDTP
jgi:hypothetical protein